MDVIMGYSASLRHHPGCKLLDFVQFREIVTLYLSSNDAIIHQGWEFVYIPAVYGKKIEFNNVMPIGRKCKWNR